jgi:uncharacterized OsmC-like protein
MIELVWDAGRFGTATTPSGSTAIIGEDADFSPDDLLAMSAAACLMRTFLRMAAEAGVPVLSFIVTGRVEPAPEGPRVALRSFVAEPAGTTDGRALQLLSDAVLGSPVCRMLGGHVIHTPVIQMLCGPQGG